MTTNNFFRTMLALFSCSPTSSNPAAFTYSMFETCRVTTCRVPVSASLVCSHDNTGMFVKFFILKTQCCFRVLTLWFIVNDHTRCLINFTSVAIKFAFYWVASQFENCGNKYGIYIFFPQTTSQIMQLFLM